ncbi:winged helix DNA-binding domain-containing protein [Amycolatopsis sp. H20-H5]|uniref:winged helix DNA-binding domain-containing protein n=1 Tax=Amycolatopsis sp. H20-H5 TaxID=3046309 RepID=UPI002DBF4E8A|nr:winged helix DNA-binding domain-containing protein [Amycolatopsis sp. H20-H5]MEC3979235.1 winged helix DNA-binding domain-containing protein [Amycolatopsis sp. H20-H5]
MLEVGREQVLAYRIAAQGLHRTETGAAKLAVFDLGLQDSVRDTALLALSARLDADVRPESLVDSESLVLAWSHRGAPHFHRRAELAAVTAGLVPLDDADALARMLWQRGQLEKTGLDPADVLFTAARAIRKVVTGPMTKGTASTAVTKAVPEGFSYWCRGCGATHIYEQLMRVATLHGGVRLEAGATPATLAPLEARGPVRTKPDVAAATEIVARYLRVHGPATLSEAAAFVGTTKTIAARMWPAGLAEVSVDGKRAYLPAERVAELESPPEPDFMRLLPPLDPLTQARDRAVLVPDKARQKEVWKILGNPGVLLADGEIAGVWRAKAVGRKRLDVTITPFTPLPAPVRKAAEAEAERVAAARLFPDQTITFS